MENNKKSFLLYLGQKELIYALSNEQAGVLFKAIYEYQLTNIMPDLEGVIKIAFLSFKEHLDLDNEKYLNICERNKINGLKGGRPKKEENPKNPVGILETQKNPKKPKKAHNDNDNDNDNDLYIKETKKINKKPTPEEIKDYCIERKNNVDADKFYDYYESNGWMVGKNKMKDWKACVRTWERNSYQTTTTSNEQNKEVKWDGNGGFRL